MPPKIQETVKSSSAEFYNIDFGSELLREGAVVAGTKTMKSKLWEGALSYLICNIIHNVINFLHRHVAAYTRQKVSIN